ncbi:hypothetical protein [Williamsia sterculiae]|nr:hypothetical protein [Williamsia sterculiae]
METAAPKLVPIDRLGRPLAAVDDWHLAEEALEDLGLALLLGRFVHRGHRVRIRQVYDDRVIVTTAMSDAIGDVGTEFEVKFPVESELVEEPHA